MSLLQLYLIFLRFGLLCFGGGYMLVPLLTAELVGPAPAPLSPTEFANLLSIAQATPGPIGINTATYVGFTQHGMFGAWIATLGIVTPSLFLVLLAIKLLRKYESSIPVQGFLAGMRPAAFGLILSAAMIFSELSIFSRALPWREWFTGHAATVGVSFVALALSAAVMYLMLKTKISFLWLLLGAGVLGAIFCR